MNAMTNPLMAILDPVMEYTNHASINMAKIPPSPDAAWASQTRRNLRFRINSFIVSLSPPGRCVPVQQDRNIKADGKDDFPPSDIPQAGHEGDPAPPFARRSGPRFAPFPASFGPDPPTAAKPYGDARCSWPVPYGGRFLYSCGGLRTDSGGCAGGFCPPGCGPSGGGMWEDFPRRRAIHRDIE